MSDDDVFGKLAQEIAGKVRRGELGYPDPYQFTRRSPDSDWLTDHFASMMSRGQLGTREAEKWFPEQVRGTAPEPPADGFLIPPGMAEELHARLISSYIEVPNELLMDFGAIPDTRPKPPPPTWRQKLRSKAEEWREQGARRAYKAIAGYWPSDGEDDW